MRISEKEKSLRVIGISRGWNSAHLTEDVYAFSYSYLPRLGLVFVGIVISIAAVFAWSLLPKRTGSHCFSVTE